jgi:dTMP kinase
VKKEKQNKDKPQVESGRFIVFEGLDGSGKSTQLALLSKRLTERGIPHITTAEPAQSNAVGGWLKQLLNSPDDLEIDVLAMLFAANRLWHAVEIIAPALAAGQWVLCDRYYYSSMAYQGVYVATTHNHRVMTEFVPDYTFFIDVSVENCLERLAKRDLTRERFENAAKLASVREAYANAFARLDIKKAPDNILCIAADGLEAETVGEKVWGYLIQ